ncbi:MAG: sel1 repeat family protein [Candidatus Protochlamydia sp.]|nr:sel1 repeat family protein [Candidatus Protochlamydia sp.]
MNEIDNNRPNIISEWRETGPKQGVLWRIQTLVQAVAWTIFTGFLGPIFSQPIYNLWREAWKGRIVELYVEPIRLPMPIENTPYVEPVTQYTAPPEIPPPQEPLPDIPIPKITPEGPKERFSTKEKAQIALKALLAQPLPELNVEKLNLCELATQLDLSEAPFISRLGLEQIIKVLSLTEILLPFPLSWNEWQKPAGLFLNPIETLRYILSSEKLPIELKITIIFNASIANDAAQQSFPFADLFATLSPQESLKLFKWLDNFSDDQARTLFKLLLMSAHRNAQCLPQLQAILAAQPRVYLQLFVNHPQYNSILDVYIINLCHESFVALTDGMNAATIQHLFHRLTPQPEKQKLLLHQLMSFSEKEEFIYTLYSNSDDRNTFLQFITFSPDLARLLIKKIHQNEDLETLQSALEFFLSSYSDEVCLASFESLLGDEKNIFIDTILNSGMSYTPDHSSLFVNLCLIKMKDILAGEQPEEEKKHMLRNVVQKLTHAPDFTTCARELTKIIDPTQNTLIMQALTKLSFPIEFSNTMQEINLEKFIFNHAFLNSADLTNPLFPLDKTNMEKIFQTCSGLNELKWNYHNDLSPLLSLEILPSPFKLEMIPQSIEAFESLLPLLSNKEEGEKLFNSLKAFSTEQANLFLEVSSNKKNDEQNNNLKEILRNLPLAELLTYFPVLIKNKGKMASYYQIAADQGDMNSQHDLGLLYAVGRGGVEKDIKKAFHYYELAADHGHVKAQLNLGFMYIEENNDANALKYLKLAADQSNSDAQFHLGIMYSIDPSKKNEENLYIKLAAGQGHLEAIKYLKK